MIRTFLAIAALAGSWVGATAAAASPTGPGSLPTFPECALGCLVVAKLDQCSIPYNDACACGSQVYLKSFDDCIQVNCDSEDLIKDARDALVALCKADGITITTPLPVAEGRPTPTGTGK